MTCYILHEKVITRFAFQQPAIRPLRSSYLFSAEIMNTATIKHLIHRLVEIEANDSPLITCTLDLEQPETDVLRELDGRAEVISSRLGGQRRSDFDDAFADLRSFVQRRAFGHGRSAVIYSRWGDHPVFIPTLFDVPMETQFIVDQLPHIYPLIELKDTYHRFVVVITTEDEARILETTLGSVTEEILASRPDLREKIGREWTREHYHNHKHEKEQQFIREKIRIVEELMQRRGHNHLIVAGSPKMAARLTRALPAHLKSKLISTVNMNPRAGISPILLEAVHLFVAAENVESHDRVSELERAVLSGRMAVAGYDACRDALEQGYADVLIVDQNFVELEQREELVRLASIANVPIETVNGSEALQRLSGMGCLLRFQPGPGHGSLFVESAAA